MEVYADRRWISTSLPAAHKHAAVAQLLPERTTPIVARTPEVVSADQLDQTVPFPRRVS